MLAWEADRSAGVYTLDERIARDLERRRRAAGEETGDEGTAGEESCDSVPGGDPARTAAEAGQAHSQTTEVRSAVPSRVYSSRTQVAAADLAQLRRRISHAEASNNSRGVVRALSVHATRSLRAQGRAARERRGRASEAVDPSTQAGDAPVSRSQQGPGSAPQTETIAEDEEGVSSHQARSAQSAADSGTSLRLNETHTGMGPGGDAQLARTLSLRGHRMLAEAAERRMRAEKEARLKASSAVRAQGTLHEEDGNAEPYDPTAAAGQASSSATTGQATSPSPPPRARPPPPPPPPRSRPAPAERSPTPAFSTNTPSIAWGAAAGASSQPPLRRPASIRRMPPPPPPPPNAAEILAAKRASLRPVTVSPSGASATLSPRLAPPPTPAQQESSAPAASASSAAPAAASGTYSDSRAAQATSGNSSVTAGPSQSTSQSSADPSASPPRRRPLPAPPRVLSEDRIDAFTALQRSRELSPQTPSSNHEQTVVGTTRTNGDRPQRAGPAEPAHPGPPLPRRPPGRPAPARPTAEAIALENREETTEATSVLRPTTGTSIVRDATASTELPQLEIPELSMYTDLDLLLARLESGQDIAAAATSGSPEQSTERPQGGENYDVSLRLTALYAPQAERKHIMQDLLVLSDVLGQAVPAGATAAELADTLAVARVECERRRVTKDGKVKSKLSVVGVRCVDCAVSLHPLRTGTPKAQGRVFNGLPYISQICLARFKVDQFAVVLPDCLHMYVLVLSELTGWSFIRARLFPAR